MDHWCGQTRNMEGEMRYCLYLIMLLTVCSILVCIMLELLYPDNYSTIDVISMVGIAIIFSELNQIVEIQKKYLK